MKNIFLTITVLALLASCKKELEPQSTTITAPPVTSTPAVPVTQTVPPQAMQATANPNVQVAPQQVSPQPVAAQTITAPQKVAKGMNPPHGQPNHRCDIAVGASLSLPISKTKPVSVATPTAGSASIIPVKVENTAVPGQLLSPEAAIVPPTEIKTTEDK